LQWGHSENGGESRPDGVVRLRQPTPTTITFMADEREAPTEDEGERPPKVKKIRSLAEEEMDEESDEEPLLTKRKKRGVNVQEGQHEPFLLAIGGQAGPRGEGGGTGYLDLPNIFNRYGGPPKEKQRARSSEGSGPAKEAGEDAALKNQGGAEGGQLEEEEAERMEGLEEERPAKMEGVKGEKPAESQGVEERERGEKERVKNEKKDKEKKDKKKKKGQKKEGEKSGSGKSSLGEGTARKGGPDVALKMALEIPDPLIQAEVARTLRLNRGEVDSKDSASTTEDEEEGQGEERGRAEKERAQEKEKGYGHIFGGGTRTRQTARITAGSARLKQPPTEAQPTESSREATPELKEGVGGESSEDRKIEELKATRAQLDEELRLKEIRVAREREEAAQVVKEQLAIEKKLPEGVERTAVEIVEEVLEPGVGERQAKGGEKEEGDTLQDERTDAREELGKQGEAVVLKGERAGERKRLGDEQLGEEPNDEVMEEGQMPQTEYQTIELAELLTGPQRKERRERQGVKIPEWERLDAERDI
jgi:hypothetical protein